MFSSEADMFFREPSDAPSIPGTFGVLYLLRRDILQCFGLNPNTGKEYQEPILWPGGMAILAGIDLLAKFFKGSDAIGEVGQRFKSFIDQYFQLSLEEDRETIYQLRNSLLHSFGLYSQTKTQQYHFVLTANNNKMLIQKIALDKFQIDLRSLHCAFENALIAYAMDLNKSEGLQVKFLQMFPNYGALSIGSLNQLAIS